MRTIVELFINPMTWFVIGFFILSIRWRKLGHRNQRLGVWLYVFTLYFFSLPVLPFILNSYLEDKYPPLDINILDSSKSYNIIVLGGGMGYDRRLPANSLLEPVMIARLVEGIRVHKALPNSSLITSGYSRIGRKPQGEVAREAAILIGVPDTSVFAQGKSSNTHEEALEYTSAWGKETPVIIATSAIHIPRAVYLFEKAGVKEVIASPTHYRIKRDTPFGLIKFLKPNILNLVEITASLHEIVGIWYAKWIYYK